MAGPEGNPKRGCNCAGSPRQGLASRRQRKRQDLLSLPLLALFLSLHMSDWPAQAHKLASAAGGSSSRSRSQPAHTAPGAGAKPAVAQGAAAARRKSTAEPGQGWAGAQEKQALSGWAAWRAGAGAGAGAGSAPEGQSPPRLNSLHLPHQAQAQKQQQEQRQGQGQEQAQEREQGQEGSSLARGARGIHKVRSTGSNAGSTEDRAGEDELGPRPWPRSLLKRLQAHVQHHGKSSIERLAKWCTGKTQTDQNANTGGSGLAAASQGAQTKLAEPEAGSGFNPSPSLSLSPSPEPMQSPPAAPAPAPPPPAVDPEFPNSYSHTPTLTAPNNVLIPWEGLSKGAQSGPVEYHNGPVLARRITVYLIYYGNWGIGSGQESFEAFLRGLSDPSMDGQGVPTLHEWWSLAQLYYERPPALPGRPVPVNRTVVLGDSVTVSSGYQLFLNDGSDGGNDDFAALVLRLLREGALPTDPNGVYFVLTSGDIKVGRSGGGFCKAYCGWHSWVQAPSGHRIHYSFVGDATTQCNNGCAGNKNMMRTPNGNYIADSMIDTFAHELVESATNPDVSTGWWSLDEDGVSLQETADLCSGVYTDAANPVLLSDAFNTYKYNMQGPNGYKFLVQSYVDTRTQSCVISSQTYPFRGYSQKGGSKAWVRNVPLLVACFLVPFLCHVLMSAL